MVKIFLIVLGILLSNTQVFSAEKTIFITSTDAPPFSGEKLKNQGVSIEIIKQALNQVGYKTKIEFYPWKRALEMAKRGVSDGVGPLWYTKERAEWLVFSKKAHTPSSIGFFKKKNEQIHVKDYGDLKPYVIGYVLGFAYSQDFYNATYDFEKVYFYNPINLMNGLVHGQIELAIMGKSQGEFILKNEFPEANEKFHFMEPVLETKNQYLAISKRAKDYKTKLNDFNRGLEMIIKDGTLDKILDKHGMK